MTIDENVQQIRDSWKAFATRDTVQIHKYFKEYAVWIRAVHRQ